MPMHPRAQDAGAVRNDNAHMVMQTSTLMSNSADDAGGAIFNYHARMEMLTCNLTSNEALYYGGAFCTPATPH